MKKIDIRIAEKSAQQHGLVSRDQLLEQGSRDQITRRLKSGLLVPVYQSVYRVPTAPITWRQKLLAACWSGGRLCMGSFRAAAYLALLEAVRRNLVDIPRAWAEHERLGGTFRLGGDAMLRALKEFVPPIRPTESVGESEVLMILRDHDFPEPTPQFWLTLADGERIRWVGNASQ